MKRDGVFAKGMTGLLLAGSLAAPCALWADCAPGWTGVVLAGAESPDGWSVQADGGSSGVLSSTRGVEGQALRFDWSMGAGDWVQAVYDFPASLDLSNKDIFGFTFHGGGPSEEPNKVTVMFADASGTVRLHNLTITEVNGGLNEINRWIINMPMPKKSFVDGWGEPVFQWDKVRKFFVVIKRPSPSPPEPTGGGSGTLLIDTLRTDRAQDWPRPAAFETVSSNPTAAAKAVSYIMGQQNPSNGLIVSWKEEPDQKSWLYDQALALMALTRAGVWDNGPANDAARAAERLANFLKARQKFSGDTAYWARGWRTSDGTEISDSLWVGDQAWTAIALSAYAKKANDPNAMLAAQRSGAWIADLKAAFPGPAGGVVGHAEGDQDAWWAMMATFRFPDAQSIQAYLLNSAPFNPANPYDNTLWDQDLRYWHVALGQPLFAIDAAAWTSAFARHPWVNQPQRGLDALGVVRRTLVTQSNDGSVCGFDGMGPVSVWNESLGHFAAAGGPDAQMFLNTMLSQQRSDGGVPGSPDQWTTTLGWLSPWTGLAATCWLYFALTGMPFNDVPRAFEASSGDFTARYAFDGDTATRWSSDASDPQWLMRYFGVDTVINRVTLKWEAAYGKAYQIQTSNDGQNWTTMYSTVNADFGWPTIRFSPVSARYVRLYGTERGTPYGYSLWEMETGYDVAATASSEESAQYAAAYAFDGDMRTRWSSAFSDPQWLQIDLGASEIVNHVGISWEYASAKSYRVQVSNNGTSWTDVYSTAAGDGGVDAVWFAPVMARYVRMYGEERNTPFGYSVYEMYAAQADSPAAGAASLTLQLSLE